MVFLLENLHTISWWWEGCGWFFSLINVLCHSRICLVSESQMRGVVFSFLCVMITFLLPYFLQMLVVCPCLLSLQLLCMLSLAQEASNNPFVSGGNSATFIVASFPRILWEVYHPTELHVNLPSETIKLKAHSGDHQQGWQLFQIPYEYQWWEVSLSLLSWSCAWSDFEAHITYPILSHGFENREGRHRVIRESINGGRRLSGK